MEPKQEETDALTHAGEKQESLRGWWIKTILILLLVVLSVVLLFRLGGYLTGEDVPQLTFSELLRAIDYPLFALLVGVVLLYIAVESGKYAYLLKVYTGKFRPKVAVKTMFLGKYYDGITPLSTGGQPFQIYYLHKKEIPGGAASAIPVMRYLVSIVFLSALSIVLLAIAPRYVATDALPTTFGTLYIVSWVSLGLNMLFPAAVLLFSIFPATSKRVSLWVIGVLVKIRIVKRQDRASIKCVRTITDYSEKLKQFGREAYKFVPLYLLCMVESALFVTLPFFVVIAIANVPPTAELAVQIACLTVISRYTALLIPTPGNTGALEAASSIVFVTVAGIGSVIGWSVLVWRFFTYYVYILSGIGISIFEIIRSAVRRRRAARV